MYNTILTYIQREREIASDQMDIQIRIQTNQYTKCHCIDFFFFACHTSLYIYFIDTFSNHIWLGKIYNKSKQCYTFMNNINCTLTEREMYASTRPYVCMSDFISICKQVKFQKKLLAKKNYVQQSFQQAIIMITDVFLTLYRSK